MSILLSKLKADLRTTRDCELRLKEIYELNPTLKPDKRMFESLDKLKLALIFEIGKFVASQMDKN